jgi:hypothetical protein
LAVLGRTGLYLKPDAGRSGHGRVLVCEKDIIDGNYHIHWLEQFLAAGGGMES